MVCAGEAMIDVLRSFVAEIISWMKSPGTAETKKFHAATVRDCRFESLRYRSVAESGTFAPFLANQIVITYVLLSDLPS